MKKRKYIFIGVAIFTILIGSFVYISTTNEKFDKPKLSSDKSLLAVYIEGENGEYIQNESNAFPKEGYNLNLEKSSCQNGGVLSQDSATKKVSVQVSNADRCNLYFDKSLSPVEEVIEKLGVKPIEVTETVPDFSAATTSSEAGVYSMEDDYGTSYFYRGAVTNNYVKFANFYWRIIRVNGDGSVRIRYDGTSAHANGENTEDRFTHPRQPYNANYNDAKYVGWMYGPAGTGASTSKEEAQTNTANSDIKTIVDGWYKTNIVDAGYSESVEDTIFCNDRSTPGSAATGLSSDTGLGYGTNKTAYGATARLGVWNSGTTKTQPSFVCPNKNDAFTVEDEEKGNGALTYPVGLITADEVVAAGSGKYNTNNTTYYLYNSNTWSWSLSSRDFNGSISIVLLLNTSGGLSGNGVYSAGGAVAPVINLSSEYFKTLKGTGSMSDPFRAE